MGKRVENEPAEVLGKQRKQKEFLNGKQRFNKRVQD